MYGEEDSNQHAEMSSKRENDRDYEPEKENILCHYTYPYLLFLTRTALRTNNRQDSWVYT